MYTDYTDGTDRHGRVGNPTYMILTNAERPAVSGTRTCPVVSEETFAEQGDSVAAINEIDYTRITQTGRIDTEGL